MFEYSYSRLLAKINNLRMESRWIYPELIEANEPDTFEGELGTTGFETIRDACVAEHGVPHHLKDFKNKQLRLVGYFQHLDYIYYDEPFIRSLWKTEPIEKRPSNEIVIHLRLGDYFDPGLRSVISPDWHENILRQFGFSRRKSKLYIVVEDPNDLFLRNYHHYKPTIISQSAKDDFNFIRSFDNIVCSNSSFCWWAAFLSEASKIYTFKPWLRFPADEHLNLADMRNATPVKGKFYK